MQLSSAYSRFIQALNVMNAAMERHRDSLILRPLIAAADSQLEGQDLVVAVVDSGDPSAALDFITIRWEAGAFVLVSHGRIGDRIDWSVTENYLTEVATHPLEYIENPHLLDFKWLEHRVQFSPWAALDSGTSRQQQGSQEDLMRRERPGRSSR